MLDLVYFSLLDIGSFDADLEKKIKSTSFLGRWKMPTKRNSSLRRKKA
jgi:hypothetical protein